MGRKLSGQPVMFMDICVDNNLEEVEVGEIGELGVRESRDTRLLE